MSGGFLSHKPRLLPPPQPPLSWALTPLLLVSVIHTAFPKQELPHSGCIPDTRSLVDLSQIPVSEAVLG